MARPEKPTIRIIHPRGSLLTHGAALQAGISALEEVGCAVRWEAERGQARWRGLYAGDDDKRYQEFMAALEEPGIDLVWCARGGSGASRIADRVVQACQSKQSRPIIGFSDVSAFINPLSADLGWRTFHGPVVTSLGRSEPLTDLKEILSVVFSPRGRIDFEPCDGPEVVGYLRGGNLTVLAASVGSHFGPRPRRDSIWFFEDIAEAPYRLHRSLSQLKNAGSFDGAAALWLGDLDLQESDMTEFAQCLEEDIGVPILRHAPAGHSGRLSCLPLGDKVRIIPAKGQLYYEREGHGL